MQDYKILVVDDEEDLCQILKYNLESAGYHIEVANSGEEALTLDLQKFDLFLLDVMMKNVSGFDLIRILRNEKNIKAPVVFITAMGAEEDLTKGFDCGADDYIIKPFSVKEVELRIKAVLSRYQFSLNEIKNTKGLGLDSKRKRVFVDKEPVELTRTEYDIFTMLFSEPGKVYSRTEILNSIWTDQQYVLGRTVDVNITRIRKKLGMWGKCIVTRSGYGYYFDNRRVSPAEV